jgi:hypothetical protein
MHRSAAPLACANSSDLLKLCLTRLSFAPSDLLSPESSQLRNSLKHPTCLTSLLYQLLLRTAGPTTWVKAFPCTLEDCVLSFSLPSHVSLPLVDKRKDTEGKRGDYFFSHSILMELSRRSSSSSSIQTWLLRTHTIETWDQAPSLISLYRATTNQCKQHEQHELDVGYYSTEARTSINPYACLHTI